MVLKCKSFNTFSLNNHANTLTKPKYDIMVHDLGFGDMRSETIVEQADAHVHPKSGN